MFRFPDYMTKAEDGGKVVSLTHRPPLPSRKYSWYSFLLKLSRTQGHSAARRFMSLKNSYDTIGNRTRNLQTYTAVPQPTATQGGPKRVAVRDNSEWCREVLLQIR